MINVYNHENKSQVNIHEKNDLNQSMFVYCRISNFI